ncbi:MAG: hypothetical protein ACM3U2_15620 [Deltaproteobacteria bacterium]
MSNCPNCGRPQLSSRNLCPECSRRRERDENAFAEEGPVAADTGDDQGRDRAMIARFQSGAEAGYFADELTRETEIETEVLARERFDGVHAAWSVDYILLVDRAHAERAARLLQSLVEATGDDAGADATDESSRSDLPGGAWVPLILTLAAGSIACFGIERLDHRPRPPALVVRDGREPPELWEFLAATRGTWIQKLDGAPGVRELTLDPDTHSARLKEDSDGDGHIDREWKFSWKNR